MKRPLLRSHQLRPKHQAQLLVLSLAAAAPAANAQQFINPSFTAGVIQNGVNTTTGLGSTTVSFGGRTFINRGLQGVGRIDAAARDAFGETFGSVSALQIGGWQKTQSGYSGSFYTLPDRGYNSGTFFSDYQSRVHQLDFTFTPFTGAGGIGGSDVASKKTAQNQIVASYVGATKFTYENPLQANALTATTGLDPAKNTQPLFGETMPNVPAQKIAGIDYPVNRLAVDAEGLVLRPNGSGWLSDEYGANIYFFDDKKQIKGALGMPEALRPHDPVGTLSFDSVNAPKNGRRNNQGIEGIALSPDGTRLFALLQSATVQDTGSGQQTRKNTRLLIYDVSQGDLPSAPIHEYALTLPIFDKDGNAAPDRTAAQSEIVALDNERILILSRDGNGLGNGNNDPVAFKSVLLADLGVGSPTDILGTAADAEGGQISPGGTLAANITPVAWHEVVNLLNTDQLGKFNVSLDTTPAGLNELTISEKWEGLSLVPALDPNAPDDYFLFVANDNDFVTADGLMRLADGNLAAYDASLGAAKLENDTLFLAYRVTVPEPATWGLVAGLGALGFASIRRMAGSSKR